MTDYLDASFSKLITEKRSPGIGAVVINKSGQKLYSNTFGRILIDDDNSAPFRIDTEMMLFSLTKILTSTALLQLMERGLVGLDDPVLKYLPSEPPPVIMGFDEDGELITRVARTELKVVHLATHTSGYTYDLWDELIYKYRTSKSQSIGNCLPVSAKHQFEDNFLVADPGTRYCYSFSVDKLGQVIEAITGQILPDYVRDNITGPLGMSNTNPHPKTEEYLRCHYKSGDGTVSVTPIVPDPKPYRYGGGHYSVGTLEDWSTMLLVLLNNGTHPHTGVQILNSETVDKYMFTDQLSILRIPSDGPHPVGVFLKSLYDLGSVNAGELLPGTGKGWGVGLMLNLEDVERKRKAGSGAWAGLANMYTWVDRRAGVAGVVGTSFLPFMDGDVLAVAEEVERWVYRVGAGSSARGEEKCRNMLAGGRDGQ